MYSSAQGARKDSSQSRRQSSLRSSVNYRHASFTATIRALRLTPWSKASVRQCILSQTVPHLVNLFVNPDEIESRSRILLLLSDVISATSSEFQAAQDSVDHASLLAPFKDDLLNLVIAGLQTPSTRCQGVTTLRRMLATQNFLTPEELSFGIHCVNEILLEDQDDDDARYW
jgi:hypothetical protein